jgi:hypothetical protein
MATMTASSTPHATIDTTATGQSYDCTDVQESLFQVDWIHDKVITDYLVGMSYSSITVVRLDANGLFESYATLKNINLNWGSLTPKTGGSTFGAAFTYYGSGKPRVFFSSNVDGWGIWELQFPVTITNTCWNSMVTPPSTAVQCNMPTPATLKRVSSSQVTTSNDGFNCRQKQILFIGETKAPTKALAKASTKQPTKSPTKQPTKNPTKSPTKQNLQPQLPRNLLSSTASSTKGLIPTGCVFSKPEISCSVDTAGVTVSSPSLVYYPTSVDGVFDGESYNDNPYYDAGCIAPPLPPSLF